MFIDTYTACTADADVVAVSIENHAHAWPGLGAAGFDGTAQIVAFLLQHGQP